MPRRARMYLPDYPYHIVQRGNNWRNQTPHLTGHGALPSSSCFQNNIYSQKLLSI